MQLEAQPIKTPGTKTGMTFKTRDKKIKLKRCLGNHVKAKDPQTPGKQLVISVLGILCFRMMTRTLLKAAMGKI